MRKGSYFAEVFICTWVSSNIGPRCNLTSNAVKYIYLGTYACHGYE